MDNFSVTMFKSLPKYILYSILDRLVDEEDLKSCQLVNRDMESVLKTYGTNREIILCKRSDRKRFIETYVSSLNCLRVLYVSGISNPCVWIPEAWPHTTCFINCEFEKLIAPPKKSNTEDLVIKCKQNRSREDIEFRLKNPLSINTKLLPRLRRLTVTTLNFDFSCLEECKNLEFLEVKISSYFTGIRGVSHPHVIPTSVKNLPKLKEIFTNCRKKRKFNL